jgi:hypothetical protein
MLPNQISFGTIEAYYATPGDTLLGKHMIFSQWSSFSYPCETFTFSSDFNTMYFSKFPKKDNKEKIYMAKFTTKGKKQVGWFSEESPLDFCTDNSTYTHPTLSADENILIFASDKAGSLGGMDLFLSVKEENKWSAPINLGNLINTTGNEFFPFLDSDNNLFFSSDGLPGYGGYDIFTSRFNGKTWDKPINLSRRINSENDDIAFTINKTDGKTAFFTRRQKSDKSEMQLFRAALNKEVADGNQLTISYIFHGKPLMKTSLTAAYTTTKVKPVESEPFKKEPENEVVKKEAEVKVQQTISQPEVKKEEVKVPETTDKPVTLPVKKPVLKPEAKVVTIKPTIPTPSEQKDIVIYRVQFLSSTKPQKDHQIIVDGKNYNIYEYFYLGAYRYTIGEFTALSSAIELQNTCRKTGLPHAFIAAFKNNTRSLDLKLFK